MLKIQNKKMLEIHSADQEAFRDRGTELQFQFKDPISVSSIFCSGPVPNLIVLLFVTNFYCTILVKDLKRIDISLSGSEYHA